MRYYKVIAISIFLMITFTFEAFAQKKITIINNRHEKLYTAIRYNDFTVGDEGEWTTEGWFITEPWDSTDIRIHTEKNVVYIYTYQKDPFVSWEGSRRNSKNRVYWISDDKMYFQQNIRPRGRNPRQVRFQYYKMPNKAHTLLYEYQD